MNKLIQRLWLVVGGVLLNSIAFAQEKSSGLDDTMRSSGKIYIVVASCLIILVGLFIYIFIVDRKVSRLEKENR